MNFDTADYWNKRYLRSGFAGAGSEKKESLDNPNVAIQSFEKKFRGEIKSVLKGRVEKVLYFGAGTGRFIPFVFEFGKRVYCVDVSSVGIGIIKRSFSHLSDGFLEVRVISEGERLPFEDGSFDVAFSFNTFIHVKRELLPFYLSEIKRCCKMFVAVEHFFAKSQLPEVSSRRPHMNYVSLYEFSVLANVSSSGPFYCIGDKK